jgi:hypothetical protein
VFILLAMVTITITIAFRGAAFALPFALPRPSFLDVRHLEVNINTNVNTNINTDIEFYFDFWLLA